MNVLFFGMRGQLSSIPLSRCIAAGIEIRAVFVPASPDVPMSPDAAINELTSPPARSELPLATRFSDPNTIHLAWEHGIPVYAIRALGSAAVQSVIAGYKPDVVCVSCFDKRIPPALLALPAHGWLNLHPSLLPAYRGPAPLFWAIRNGERTIGVTVHRMVEALDAGPILLQTTIDIADGIYGEDLEARCARIGGDLMVETVRRLEAGTITPQPQLEAEASTYSSPSAEDFHVPTSWPAQRAYNFIRGVSHWHYPPDVESMGRRLHIRDAVTYSASGELSAPFVQEHDVAWIQFSPGYVQVVLTHET